VFSGQDLGADLQVTPEENALLDDTLMAAERFNEQRGSLRYKKHIWIKSVK